MITAFALATAVAVSVSSADTVVSVSPEARLWIRNLPGQISVETWTRNAVRLQTRGGHPRQVRIAKRGPRVVTIETPRNRQSRSAQYAVTVPSWMSVTLVSPDANASVHGVKGDLMVRTVNGAVSVEGSDGPIFVSSVQGPIHVAGVRGKLEVNTVNGSIHLDDIAGQVNAETVNGSIALARMVADSIEASTVNGAVTFDGSFREGGWYRFTTHRGDIDVGLPPSPDARVSVATYAGEFESDVPVRAPRAKERRHLQFTLGDGKSWLQLESFLGRIRLTKKKAHRAPPPAFEWPDRLSSTDEDKDDEEDKE